MAKYLLQRRLTLPLTVCFAYCVSYSYAVPCNPNTWIQMPGTDGVDTTLAIVSSLGDCQSVCTNLPYCYGVSWNGTTCFYNSAPSNSSNSGISITAPSTVTYYALIQNYTNCNFNAYNCTFNWTGQPTTHGFSGTNANKNNFIDCIRTCQDDDSCMAMDWNSQDATCWTYSFLPYIGSIANITHFTKNCTNGLTATTKPTTQGPFTTTPSTTSTSTATTTTTTSTSTTVPTTTTTTTPTSTISTAMTTSTTVPTTTTTTPTSTISTAMTTTKLATPTSTTTTTTTATTSTTTTSTATTTTSIPRTTASSTTTTSSTTATATSSLTKRSTMGPPMSTTTQENEMLADEMENTNPLAIKPAYVVLAAIGGGCILLVITAIVILCTYPLHKPNPYPATSTASHTHTHHSYHDDEHSYGEAASVQDEMNMNEVNEVEQGGKTYYNADDVN